MQQLAIGCNCLGHRAVLTFSRFSWTVTMQTLGMKLIAVEDLEALARVRHRLAKQDRKRPGKQVLP